MLPVERFVNFIEQNNLFDKNSRILAAVSGGMDSVLLAHLLNASGYEFGLAHCNFQLRGQESLRDEEFCRALASSFKVSFHSIHFDTEAIAREQHVSVQMAARSLRYQWFAQIAYDHAYHVTAVAHHQNDTIETILLNLTRGTGIAGLRGILPKNGLVVRPLLCFNRAEIETIVKENNINYVEDSSNASVKYARNKIRLEVIPKLKELNPALEKTFEDSLQHFQELEILLENQLNRLREELFVHIDNEIHLAIRQVNSLQPKRLLLFGLFRSYGFNLSTIDDLLAALNGQAGKLFETATHMLIVDRENLILTNKTMPVGDEIPIHKNDGHLTFTNFKLSVLHDDSPLIIRDNPMAVAVDADLLTYPLTIRSWKQGDSFYPLGMKTRKKISDFFIHEKIPLHQKEHVPLLINGNGDIIWVGGYRPDERYKVSDQTKKVTIFELFKL